jgi:glyoxylase-like metal-dependent hydrolase (beta-lactamase superfamily II)
MRASMNTFALHHLTVFERGWLSSNNILLHGDSDDEGATLVDSGHCVHAEQTVALVRHALPGAQTLRHIVNTHLHSDHCGGNAALQRAFPGVLLSIPPGQADAVSRWDEDALSYRATGQRIERFAHDALLRPGESLTVGTRTWQALAAPGHDPHSLVLFDAHDGVLISADALWGNGFGVVFPELDGEQAFDEVAAVLDAIESLAPRVVVPGHGAPFTDVAAALQRARKRLAAFVADPPRHARHGAKVLLKYHVMEERVTTRSQLRAWGAATPLLQRLWERLGAPGIDAAAWSEQVARELAAQGALRIDGERVIDA